MTCRDRDDSHLAYGSGTGIHTGSDYGLGKQETSFRSKDNIELA